MKKYLPIIIGVFVGMVMSVTFIHTYKIKVAYGAINLWDDIVAYGDFFDWNNVFSPSSSGKDLYALVHDKLLEAPKRDALKEVAQQYGLTKDEAQRVVNGSVIPIFNNPDRKSSKLTQEDAYAMLKDVQADYEMLNEIFTTQKEIDVAITPSELFANGDLSDSGFDLVHDLSVIEEILFVNKTTNTVGDSFDGQLDSPFLPTEPVQTLDNFVTSESSGTVFKFGSNNEALAVIPVGDKELDVEVLGEDVCPDESLIGSALNNYEESAANGDQAAAENGANGVIPDEDLGLGDGNAPDGGDQAADEESILEPAKADDWLKEWCPSLSAEDGDTSTGNTFGTTGFNSLGNVVGSLINQSMGAAAAAGGEGIKAQVAICLDIAAIKKKVSSYQPGQSCVLCEVEKINDYMNKTLGHSLIPNKATGNLFESAKCKDAGSLVNIQFIAIAAPVPTASKDDIVFGKNIFEEWKSFVDKYQPVLFPAVDEISHITLNSAPTNTTTNEVYMSIQAELAQNQADAIFEIDTLLAANDGTNTTLYAQAVYKEIEQMQTFFEGYLKLYKKITEEVCPALKSLKSKS